MARVCSRSSMAAGNVSPRRRLAVSARAVAIMVSVTGLATGCVGQQSGDESGADLGIVSIEGYEGVTAVLDFEAGTAQLPLDAVELRSPHAQALEAQALWTLVDECMVPKGFPAVADSYGGESDAAAEAVGFGLFSISLASEQGYGAREVRKDSPGGGTPAKLDPVPGYADALPPCWDTARTEMAERTSRPDDADELFGIDVRIEQAAYDAVRASAAGKDAVARRVECLEQRGIVVDPDSGASSRVHYTDPVAEITAAVADATCNVETGAAQELFDLFARYQAAYMDEYEAQVAELATQRATLVSQLQGIVSGG